MKNCYEPEFNQEIVFWEFVSKTLFAVKKHPTLNFISDRSDNRLIQPQDNNNIQFSHFFLFEQNFTFLLDIVLI